MSGVLFYFSFIGRLGRKRSCNPYFAKSNIVEKGKGQRFAKRIKTLLSMPPRARSCAEMTYSSRHLLPNKTPRNHHNGFGRSVEFFMKFWPPKLLFMTKT